MSHIKGIRTVEGTAMRLTPAQYNALDEMLQADNATIDHNNGRGVRRTTVEALARMGRATVTTASTVRQVRHRDGTTSERTVVTWTARVVPVMPTDTELAGLDTRAASVDTHPVTLPLRQRRQAAAYLALTSAAKAMAGAPATEPDWDTGTAYATLLRRHDSAELLRMYRAVRHVTGQAQIQGAAAAPARPENDPPADVWTITEPHSEPPVELFRVPGETYVAASMTARSFLGSAPFSMRRLRASEVDPGWRKDFSVYGQVLRLEKEPQGAGWQVRHLATGDVMTVRSTPEEAEADARLDMESLHNALARS